jgi:hypothetical protein
MKCMIVLIMNKDCFILFNSSNNTSCLFIYNLRIISFSMIHSYLLYSKISAFYSLVISSFECLFQLIYCSKYFLLHHYFKNLFLCIFIVFNKNHWVLFDFLCIFNKLLMNLNFCEFIEIKFLIYLEITKK